MEQSLEKVGMDREPERDPQTGNASLHLDRLQGCHVLKRAHARRNRKSVESPLKTTSGQLFLTVVTGHI